MIDRMPSKLPNLETKYLSKQNTYLSWDGLRTSNKRIPLRKSPVMVQTSRNINVHHACTCNTDIMIDDRQNGLHKKADPSMSTV